MIPSLLAASLAGFVGSPHCAGMCGGFAVGCGTTAGRTAAWHAGRLTTYAVLGALAGAFGSLLPGAGGVAAIVSALLVILFAGMLAGIIPEPKVRGRRLVQLSIDARSAGSHVGPWAFGVANGLIPCGLVWAALALPLASGSAMVGAVSMVAFGLGTVPLLTAVTYGARGLILRDIRLRRLIAAGVLISGLLSIGLRQGMLPAGDHMHTPEAPTATQASHTGSQSSLDG